MTGGQWVHMGKGPAHTCRTPDIGRYGDLWRCHCGRLWLRVFACSRTKYECRHPYGGMHAVGLAWGEPSLWQRLRHRNAGRERRML